MKQKNDAVMAGVIAGLLSPLPLLGVGMLGSLLAVNSSDVAASMLNISPVITTPITMFALGMAGQVLGVAVLAAIPIGAALFRLDVDDEDAMAKFGLSTGTFFATTASIGLGSAVLFGLAAWGSVLACGTGGSGLVLLTLCPASCLLATALQSAAFGTLTWWLAMPSDEVPLPLMPNLKPAPDAPPTPAPEESTPDAPADTPHGPTDDDTPQVPGLDEELPPPPPMATYAF